MPGVPGETGSNARILGVTTMTRSGAARPSAHAGDLDDLCINTIRATAVDAIEWANSDRFGASAPGSVVVEQYGGFTAESVAADALELLRTSGLSSLLGR
jgi:hypothetical protein